MLSNPSASDKRIKLFDIAGTSVDLLKPILSPSNETHSVVELNSDESGLRLTFDTNRRWLLALFLSRLTEFLTLTGRIWCPVLQQQLRFS